MIIKRFTNFALVDRLSRTIAGLSAKSGFADEMKLLNMGRIEGGD